MNRELADVMAAAVDARARSMGAETMARGDLDRVVTRVRRRRAVRHTTQAGVVVVAGAGIAAGGWFGLRGHEPVPPATPTPTLTTPAPPPSATPTPTPEPIVEAGFPTALPLPDGLLAQTGPGWVLTLHRPTPATTDGTAGTAVGQAVFLVSPAGEQYRVVDVPTALAVSLEHWTAGSTTAQVMFGEFSVDGTADGLRPGTLDLLTGTVTARDLVLPDDARYLGQAAGGVELWTRRGAPDTEPGRLYAVPPDGSPRVVAEVPGTIVEPLVDPTGTRVASPTDDAAGARVVVVADGSAHDVDYSGAGDSCSTVAWLDAGHLLASCFDMTDGETLADWNPALYRVAVDGDPAPTLVSDLDRGDPFAEQYVPGTWVRDGVVAYPGLEVGDQGGLDLVCATGVYLVGPDGPALLQGPGDQDATLFEVRSAAGVVYVASGTGCVTGDYSPTVLTAHDLGTGTAVVVAPAPPGYGIGAQGLTSWVVADSR